MADETPRPEGATPSPATPPEGATPDLGATPGPDENPTREGATPGDSGEAENHEAEGLHKALRAERDRRKALEKTALETEGRLKELEGELDGYRRRDAAEAAIQEPLKAVRESGMDIRADVEELKKFLVRLPVEDMPEAASELIRSMVGHRWKPARPPIAGQPRAESEILNPNTNLSTSELLRLQKVGGPAAVEAYMAARNQKR